MSNLLKKNRPPSLARPASKISFPTSMRFDIAVFVLLALLGIVTFFLWPRPILGVWESLTFFHNFAALQAYLSLVISVRANIGGQGYALLDISRDIADLLGWSLITFRLPALIIGWLGLCSFYIVTRRIAGTASAFAATILLATNPYFSFFQNTTLVSIVTFSFSILVIERMQAFEGDRKDFRRLSLFVFVVALSGLHYGMGRLLVLALLVFLFAKIFIADWRTSDLKKSAISTFRTFIYFGAFLTLTFTLLNWKNPYYFLNLRRFFVPHRSDIQYFGSDLFHTLSKNISIFFQSLIGGDTLKVTPYVSEMLFNRIYTLMPIYTLPLMAIGLAIAVVRWRKTGQGLQTPYLLVLVLLAVTAGLPMFSLLSSPEYSTLSHYRLFNVLIPAYILLAIGMRAIIKISRVQSKRAGYAVMGFALLVSAYQATTILEERKQFSTSVAQAIVPAVFSDSSTDIAEKLFGVKSENVLRGMKKQALVQLRYRFIAKLIRDQFLDTQNAAANNKVKIFYIDLVPLSRKDLTLGGLFYVAKHNFHAPFIALYAADMGVRLAYAQPVDTESTLRLGGLGYRGKFRTFSTNLAWVNGRVDYETDKKLTFHMRKTGPGTPDAYLATTERELTWLKGFLSNQGADVEIIPINGTHL